MMKKTTRKKTATRGGDGKKAKPKKKPSSLEPSVVSSLLAKMAIESEDAALKAIAFDATNQSMVIVDTDARVLFVNEAFKGLTGFDEGEVLGRTPEMYCHEKTPDFCSELAADVRRHGFWHGEAWVKRKSGDPFPVWLVIKSLKTGGGDAMGYIGTFFDISTLKKHHEKLEFMAHYDMLTNLPNRTLMYDRLKQALTLAKRHEYSVAVMLLDLDRFKDINDSMGHHVGDQLLVEVADRLEGCVRESDTVARMGGDEFLVILPEVGEATNVAHMAKKFLDSISRPLVLEGQEVYISSSIGITMFPMDGRDLNTLIKNADTAMYHAKAQGKNNFKFFTEDINKSTLERFKLESNFRRALEKLEFQLNYQPKVDLRTGEICGMEALLRWYHPEQGNVNPSLFIPLAEETGLVVQLGEWAIREACRQNREWQAMGMPPLRVSVNLSARHFHRKELTGMIADILDEVGMDPEYLMLEITENTMIENIEETISTLKRLREMGVGVSVDDFGTGYSSLNYLNQFSVDELKIDQSFVRDLRRDSDSKTVINAIIVLAHNLNLRVVAEGVEEMEQLEFLRQSGCDEVQGYHLSVPLSAEEFRILVSTGLSLQTAG